MQTGGTKSVKAHNNIIIQICAKCNNEVILTDGTITYDGKWFHNHCWQSTMLQEAEENERSNQQ